MVITWCIVAFLCSEFNHKHIIFMTNAQTNLYIHLRHKLNDSQRAKTIMYFKQHFHEKRSILLLQINNKHTSYDILPTYNRGSHIPREKKKKRNISVSFFPDLMELFPDQKNILADAFSELSFTLFTNFMAMVLAQMQSFIQKYIPELSVKLADFPDQKWNSLALPRHWKK